MKSAFINLVTRDETTSMLYDPTMATLLIVLLVLVIVALLAMIGLYYMRYRRRSRREENLPVYNEHRPSSRGHHRRLTIRPSESIYVYQEKQNLIDNSYSPPTSPLPEIRITFPEEIDMSGKRQSGAVLVVHVGDKGVALEPVNDEKLPAYQLSESDRFQSLDLDRIGGLREKEMGSHWS